MRNGSISESKGNADLGIGLIGMLGGCSYPKPICANLANYCFSLIFE